MIKKMLASDIKNNAFNETHNMHSSAVKLDMCVVPGNVELGKSCRNGFFNLIIF
jgi:hypothetical protein